MAVQKAKNPAEQTAEDPTAVHTAENVENTATDPAQMGSPGQPEKENSDEQDEAPEADSHEDLVRRVKFLETRFL